MRCLLKSTQTRNTNCRRDSVDESKDAKAIDVVYNKCADMNKKYNKEKQCFGSPASQLAKRLKDKYKTKPEITTRFKPEDRRSGEENNTSNDAK